MLIAVPNSGLTDGQQKAARHLSLSAGTGQAKQILAVEKCYNHGDAAPASRGLRMPWVVGIDETEYGRVIAP